MLVRLRDFDGRFFRADDSPRAIDITASLRLKAILKQDDTNDTQHVWKSFLNSRDRVKLDAYVVKWHVTRCGR